MPNLSDVWQELHEQYTDHAAAGNEVSNVFNTCAKIAPRFVGDDSAPLPSPATQTQLIRELNSIEPQEWSNFRRIIVAKIVQHGNLLGLWRLPIPRFRIALSWPTSPFTPQKMQMVKWLNDVNELLVKTLPELRQLTPKQQFCFLYLSVTSSGSLIEMESLTHFLAAGPKTILRRGNCLFVDVPPTAYAPPLRGGTFRPFDPLSTILVTDWSQTDWEATTATLVTDDLVGSTWSFAREFLIERGIDPRQLPRESGAFLRMCAARLHLSIEPVLANFAIGTVKSFARRSTSGELSEIAQSLIKSAGDKPVELPASDSESLCFSEQTIDEIDTRISAALRLLGSSDRDDRAQGESSLVELENDIAITQCFAVRIIQWALNHARVAPGKRKINAGKTTYKYYCQGLRRLLAIAGHIKSDTVASTKLTAIYQYIVNSWQNVYSRRDVEKVLRSFHKYLVTKHGYAPLAANALRAYSKLTWPVNAVYLSAQTIRVACDLVRNNTSIPVPEQTEIVLLLTLT